MSITELTVKPKACHLVEITAMPGVKYSLNLGYLHTAASADDACREAYDFSKHVLYQTPTLMDDIGTWLDSLDHVDIMTLSIYFWNRKPSFFIAEQVKKRWPESTIIIGGNEVSHQTEAVFAESDAVDFLVHGEGEVVFCHLLRVLHDGNLDELPQVKGISFRRNGETTIVPPGERIRDLSTIPSPLLSGVYTPQDIHDSRIIIMETNRGCPYSCAFCYWGGATQSKVRPFPLERIKDEITFVLTHASTDSTLFLADANFGILPQDVEIAEWLVAELKRLNKRVFLFTNWAKNTSKRVLRIAEILYSSNLIAAVTLSAQSFAPDALQIARRSNIKPDYYRGLQHEFQERGIPTYTELIWGMPGETLSTFLDGIEYVIDSGGFPVVYPLLLLNNTEYTTETFRNNHSVRTRHLPYQITHPEMRAEFVVAHQSMPESDWLVGMELRLSLALFHGCLMRGLLRATSRRTGRRVVDFCVILADFLRQIDQSTTLGGVITNHREIWLDPDAFDADLIVGLAGSDVIPEHLHYQAVLQHVFAAEEFEQLIRAAAEYLYADLDGRGSAPDAEEYAELVEFQVLTARALKGNMRKYSLAEPLTESLSRTVYDLLVEVGQLYPAEGNGTKTRVLVELDPYRFASSPVDSLLLAIYHGSVQVARSFQVTESRPRSSR